MLVPWTGLGFQDSTTLLSPCTDFFRWEFISPNILKIISMICVSQSSLCVSPFKLPSFKLFIVYTYSFSFILNLSNSSLLLFSIPSSSKSSMLMIGWFKNRIALHLSANSSVEQVSCRFSSEDSKVQITPTLLFPDKLFLSILVSLEDLQGMYFQESFSASPEITFPNADRELLINLASSSLTPVEFDFLTLSDPARSTREKLLVRYWVLFSLCTTLMDTMVWDRLESWFIFWGPVFLSSNPWFISSMDCMQLLRGTRVSLSTQVSWVSRSSLIWSFLVGSFSKSNMSSLQIWRKERLMVHPCLSARDSNRYFRLRGIIPWSSLLMVSRVPIVQVFPVPVCPYTKRDPLHPSSTLSSMGLQVSAKTLFCLASSSKTPSKQS